MMMKDKLGFSLSLSCILTSVLVILYSSVCLRDSAKLDTADKCWIHIKLSSVKA
jgi:hypothetical protein